MTRPPLGLCVPVNFVRARDGDTVIVRLPHSDYEWAVRLLHCWVIDKTDADKTAKKRIEQVCDDNANLVLFVPLPTGSKDTPIVNLVRSLFTFDRVLGIIFTDDHTSINDTLVREGFATTMKPPK